MSETLLRVAALVLGVLMAVGAVVVYVFALLPANAPEDANDVLAVVGIVGFSMAMAAAFGGD